jgi:hypothetical protein
MEDNKTSIDIINKHSTELNKHEYEHRVDCSRILMNLGPTELTITTCSKSRIGINRNDIHLNKEELGMLIAELARYYDALN